MKVYDPTPYGWKYGFPKEYNPSNPLEPLEYTLRRDGYPVDKYPYYRCRFWESDDEHLVSI